MKCIIIIILTLTGFAVNAVNLKNHFIKDSEEAVIEVEYIRKAVYDTTRRDSKYFLDGVILRIGKNKSMFYGVKKLWTDSMMRIDYSNYSSYYMTSFKKKDYYTSGFYWSYVYKDYSKKVYAEYESFDVSHWHYTEPLEKPNWNVGDSIKNLLGYECFEATTDFKGRQWTAWFAPEIPVSDGPWKLHGLPGLILEAHDKSHDYEFEAKGIRSSGLGLVGYMEYNDYIEVSRDEHMKNWWKYKHKNMSAQIQSIFGLKTSDKPVSTKRIPQYDREEIDYDHSLK